MSGMDLACDNNHSLEMDHVESVREQNDGYNHGKTSSATSSCFPVVLNRNTSNLEDRCKFQFEKMKMDYSKQQELFLVCTLKSVIRLQTVFQCTHKKSLC